jgi:hypothetical protein
MSRANPTAVNLGMQGMVNGLRYTVAGRVVCSVNIDGETYYWNEFRLVAGAGQEATLVFEETEEGPTWKWFQEFAPDRVPTVAELNAKRTGDTLNLGDGPAKITLADESRVHYGEGELPEGVEVGDVARYLNLDLGGRMRVVSWTGDEIEYFAGRDLAKGYVERIFGLPAPQTNRAHAYNDNDESDSTDYLTWFKVVAGAVVLLIFVANFRGCQPSRPEPPAKKEAPSKQLAVGARGALSGRAVQVTGHALVQLSQVNQRIEEHEYTLRDDQGERALLVNGFVGHPDHWLLLRPLPAQRALTPYEAARLRVGQSVGISTGTVQVAGLILTQVKSVDGDKQSDWRAPTQYGWVARRDADWLVARWTEAELRLYRGTEVSDADVRAVLATK